MTIEVLNAGLRSSTSKSGKQRFHIAVESEALAFDLDTMRLAKPVAEAFAHHLREKVRAIATPAAEATLKARAVLKKAYDAGKPWAVKRFSGGRTGATPPTESTTALNHSGRFRESIVATPASDGTFRVNVAANRLSSATGNVERIWQRLVQLVPEFQDVGKAMQSDEMLKARTKVAQQMIHKAKSSDGRLLELAKAVFETASKATSLVA